MKRLPRCSRSPRAMTTTRNSRHATPNSSRNLCPYAIFVPRSPERWMRSSCVASPATPPGVRVRLNAPSRSDRSSSRSACRIYCVGDDCQAAESLLDVPLRRVVLIRIVRTAELHDLDLIDVRQLQEPTPRRERDLRVGQRGVRLEDDLAVRAVHEGARDALQLIRLSRSQIVVRDHDPAVLEVVRRHFVLQGRVLDAPRRRGDARLTPVVSRRWRSGVVARFLPDRDVVFPLDLLQCSDRRARWDLVRGGVEVDRGGRRVEYTSRTQPEEAEKDRPQDERAHDQPIRNSAGAALPLLLLALPLTLLFLAPVTAQLGGHTQVEYRPKLT